MQVKSQADGDALMGKTSEGGAENDEDLDELQAREDALQTEYEMQLREKERMMGGAQNQMSSNL